MSSTICITKDKSKLDTAFIHDFISNSYWATGRSLQDVKKSIKNSTCFGLFDGDQQIGFGRVISDKVVFGYIMDVFISPTHSRQGLGTQLMEAMLSDPEFRKVKTWYLKTRDADKFYEHFGFKWMTGCHFMERKSNANENQAQP